MINPKNPLVLVYNREGLPAAKAKIFFFEAGTDVPKSVQYVGAGTLTNEITSDDEGKFPEVQLLTGEYTLKAFIPLDPKNPYPLFPDDYELLDTWNLSGEPEPAVNENESVATLADLDALRNYDGDETKVWIGNRLFIRENNTNYADNNGTIIVSSALLNTTWRMDLTGYTETSVAWFGADATGTNDSTAAYLSAISAIYGNDTRTADYKLPRTLYIPEGRYHINSTITFSCPVHMEKNVRFGNISGASVYFNFLQGLETDKTDMMQLVGQGYDDIILVFPAGGKVNLGWFPNRSLTMSQIANPISVYGYGSIVVDVDGHLYDLVQTEGSYISISIPSISKKLVIDHIDVYEGDLTITGNGFVETDTFRMSYLANPNMINRVHGHLLILDEDWNVNFDVDTTWGMVEGENYPTVQNTSGTSHQVMFYLADVEWKTFDAHVHDIVWVNISEPSDMNWTSADSDDWNTYLNYGGHDFTGTTTSGDIFLNKPDGITLYGLNHSGSMTNVFGSMKLDTCTVNFTTNSTIVAVYLEIVNSIINTDDPSNGNIVSQNMRLRDSTIHSRVSVANANDLEIEMIHCHFTNQISLLASTNSVKTIVLKENEVALCNFFPYRVSVQSWSAERVSIDISGNWTTDTSGQLVRTRGFLTADPGETTLESRGFVDFRRTDTGGSWISNTPFYGKSFIISGGGIAPNPSVNASGAAIVTSAATIPVKAYAGFWGTQSY